MDMKRAITLFLAIVLCVGLGSLALAGSATYKGFPIVQVTVNGQQLGGDSPPIIIGGRVYVPLRSVENGLGGRVDWDPATKTAVVEAGPAGPNRTASISDRMVTVLDEGGALAIYEAAVVAADNAFAIACGVAHDAFMLANYATGSEFGIYQQAVADAETIKDATVAQARADYIAAGGVFEVAETAETNPQIASEKATGTAANAYSNAIEAANTKRSIALNQLAIQYAATPYCTEYQAATKAVTATWLQECADAERLYLTP